ncbi:hypothetical protein EYB26_001586 [Talaromyces marneffei]|uniref:uncharacterized protein n=1 Tax=Talaromyces marneffei TaxID=37727 RepID=UPI0012A9B11F|nr:uncharacterized protein EYB26_001586 [Talaromyces marneffei]QGA13934.1 hypothetical protein EYB26_001586 [Talaromyces marneffei]
MDSYYWLFLCGAIVVSVAIFKPGLISSSATITCENLIHSYLQRVYSITNSNGQHIRGPKWSWPHGHFFDKFVNGYAKCREWRQSFGDVYRVWAANTPEIVITTSQDVRVFHIDSTFHHKSASSNAGWFFHELLGDCMGFVNGERWKQLRSKVNQHFTHEALTQSTDALNDTVRNYLMTITADQVKDETKNQVTLHVASALGKLVFYCTAERIYGPMTTDEKDELWSIGEQRFPLLRFALAGPAYRFGVFSSLCMQAKTELAEFQTNWFAFNEKMYESRRTLASRGQFIVPLWESMQENRIGKNELLQTLDEMLFANLDVASHVLTWMVIHVAENPRIQKDLREEAADEQQRSLSQYLQQKTTLLGQSFLESMRLRPFTAFSIPESASEDKIFSNDIRVPAGTSVVVDTIAINIDNPFWGEDSHKFRPERFKGISPIDMRYNLFTFGFGTRKCLGQYFAEAVVKLCVINLLDFYDIRVVHPSDGAQSGQNKTWIPASDMRLTLTKRDTSN